MIHIYYRLSDNNRRGKAPSYFTNENCLNNFLKNFGLTEQDKLTIIADNIGENTENWLRSLNLNIIKTALGNCGSFDFAFKQAIKSNQDDDIIYFVENDYLHRKGSRNALDEAFNYLNVDYTHLYDSPDKYQTHYNVNYNSIVNFDDHVFDGLKSKIIFGLNNYWRSSNCTTMTFASKVKTLKSDYDAFKAHLIWLTDQYEDRKMYEYKKIPSDYELFHTLTEARSKKMISPMPGYCTHGDLLSPLVKWIDHL